MRKLLALFGFAAALGAAQGVYVGPAYRFVVVQTVPGTCRQGDVAFQLSDSSYYGCPTANTWSKLSSGGGGGATIPNTTNVIKGDGAGNGANTKVAITSPSTAATLIFGTDNASLTFQGTGTVVNRDSTDTLTSKTLTTPTIASFTNATHNHTNAAGGGQLTDAALSAAVTLAKGGTGADQSAIAKGGLLVGTAAGTIGIKAVGADGTFLEADAASAGGTKWATVTASAAGSTNDIQVNVSGSLTGGRCTMDSSQNIVCTGTVTSGSGSGVAGGLQMLQGTASTPAANSVVFQAPTSVTAYSMSVPAAAGTGFILNTDTANVDAWTFVGSTGSGNVVRATSPTLVTPNLGTPTALVLTSATALPAAQVSSGALTNGMTATTQAAGSNDTKLATDAYVDRNVCTTTKTTGTTATLSTCFTVNQEATAATGVTYTLPTAAAGLQYCIDNDWNGSAATTGILTLATSASGQFMTFTDGTLTATGGNVTSAGAARDGACVYGIDSTHWMFLPHQGTWTKH